jgi:S-adenosyl-L-methionine hydrolase (adenosine-forming)
LPAIVTLTTDFGLRDPYVAQMKAVILGIARDVHLVDITHDVAPHDIAEGALALEAAVPYFPPGTIHVAVVDPGVGTARRGLAVTWRGSVFVGPDNGLFTPFLGQRPGEGAVFELAAAEFRCFPVSRTFHGRDLFAPAAAHVARGVDAGRLGPTVDDPVRLAWPEAQEMEGLVSGTVLHIDRFGNLITSIRAATVEAMRTDLVVEVGDRILRLVGTYGDLVGGEAGALIGSGGRLEIAVRDGRADAGLGAARGTPVRVSPSSPRFRTSL